MDMIGLAPAFSLASFVVLALFGRGWRPGVVAALGVAPVVLGFATTLIAAIAFGAASESIRATGHTLELWRWLAVAGLRPSVALHLDALSVVMCLVVTGVGALIFVYAARFMRDDEGYSRFFAYMNLFVAAMLVLVLADDLLLLYLGWEGVGLCSYLLIGFWYADPDNGRAARKAFLVTRIGDAALAVGLFLIFTELHTLHIATVIERAPVAWAAGSTVAVAAALLLLAGALGKSAQLPLHTWLPDAMAGPTPVSALIHAATMVTAGVYLVARLHPVFELAPGVMDLVAGLGAGTLLLAALAALAQRDIKRVLAYSTMSQIGYMFLALGVGAWSASIFHLMTHAFFKALLFLAAGVVIFALDGEHDLHRMGGLRRELPGAFRGFVVGGAALAGFPLVTAGFYSKDLILLQAWQRHPLLWLVGILGALLTALYIFRLVFLAFYGPRETRIHARPGPAMNVPLGVLALLSVVGGWVELPRTLGGLHAFSRFMAPALPSRAPAASPALEATLQAVSSAAVLLGILLAYLGFVRHRDPERGLPWLGSRSQRVLREGFGFDAAYDALFVRPFVALARLAREDVLDGIFRGIARSFGLAHDLLARTQRGRVRGYLAVSAVGVVVLLGLVILA